MMGRMGDEPKDQKAKTSWRVVLAPVASMFAFFLSENVLRTMIPQITQGLLFCLQMAVAMVVFAAVAAVAFPARKADTDRQRDQFAGGFFWPIAAVAWPLGIASWFALAYIETNALSQPDHSVGAYVVPVHLKSVVRYMTPTQVLIDRIASWIFFGCTAGVVAIILVRRYLQRGGRQ
jgi:Na+/melibiose symporter-like transporter